MLVGTRGQWGRIPMQFGQRIEMQCEKAYTTILCNVQKELRGSMSQIMNWKRNKPSVIHGECSWSGGNSKEMYLDEREVRIVRELQTVRQNASMSVRTEIWK